MTEQIEICNNFTEYVLPTLYGTATESYKTGAMIYGIIIDIYFLVGFLLFVYYKNKYVRLQPRSTLVTFLAMISAQLMDTVNIVIAEGVGRHVIPCKLRVIVYHFALLFIGPGIVGTLLMYIYKLRLERERYFKALASTSQTKLLKKNLSDNQAQKNQNNIGNGSPSETSFDDESRKSLCVQIIEFLNVLKYSKNGRIIVPSRMNKIVSVGDEETGSKVDIVSDDASATGTDNDSINTAAAALFSLNDSLDKNYTKTFKERFMESIGYPLAIIFLLGFHIPIALIIRIELDPPYKANCIGCDVTLVDYILNIINVGSYLVIVILGVYAMRNEQDPLGIFQEIKIVIVFACLPLIAWILLIVDPGEINKNYVFSWQFVHEFGHAGVYYAITYHQVFSALYEEKVKFSRIQRAKTQSMAIVSSEINGPVSGKDQVPTSISASMLDIDRILNEPKPRNALLEHAVDELSSENLVFLFKVKAWKQQYDRESADKITRVAINLFKEYVSRDSRTPINIPNSAFIDAERTITPYMSLANEDSSAKKSGKPPVTLFDRCEKECFMILETDTLPRFIHSEVFKKRIIEDGLLKKILKR